MATAHSVVLYDPREASVQVTTAAGLLAGYSGRTREAYTLDLRQYYRWCSEHQLDLFEVTRTPTWSNAGIPRDAPSTTARRISDIGQC